MRKLVLLSTVLFATPFTMNMSYGQCVNTLDCQALGYNKPSCINGGVKCPTGNYWYCPKDCEEGYVFINGKCQKKEIEWGECNGIAKNCNLGDILNKDGTCTKYASCTVDGFISVNGNNPESDGTCKDSGYGDKTPVGIVVHIDGDCGYALSIPAGMYVPYWAGKATDIAEIKNVTTQSAMQNDFNSCENTDAIGEVPYNGQLIHPAAVLAREFAAEGVPETKGKWCLPAAGILHKTYEINRDTLRAAYQSAGAGFPFEDYIWTSSEYSADKAVVANSQGFTTKSKTADPLGAILFPVLRF